MSGSDPLKVGGVVGSDVDGRAHRLAAVRWSQVFGPTDNPLVCRWCLRGFRTVQGTKAHLRACWRNPWHGRYVTGEWVPKVNGNGLIVSYEDRTLSGLAKPPDTRSHR